jgi:aspartate racemase
MLGILGGMGPLASAEFLKTIYRLNISGCEQEAPSCVLLSDPSFPDRTEAILEGSTGILAARLTSALEELSSRGAERIVIACVTIHHVLPDVPERLRRKVVSLLDLIAEEVRAARQPHLLLATTGTRTARIFERHAGWDSIADCIRLLDDDDQYRMHEWIYHLKRSEPTEGCLAWLESLAPRYGTDRFIFACTELHLLLEPLSRSNGIIQASRIIDPLLSVARDFHKLALTRP